MVPEPVLRGSEDMQRGFLQALFTADGTVLDQAKSRRDARLTSVSLDLLRTSSVCWPTSVSSAASIRIASGAKT